MICIIIVINHKYTLYERFSKEISHDEQTYRLAVSTYLGLMESYSIFMDSAILAQGCVVHIQDQKEAYDYSSCTHNLIDI